MIRKLHYLLILVFICCSTGAWSQKSLVKAERQFELKAFELAIESAKKALEDDPACLMCHYIIAESFRMMNENVDAAAWYAKMENFTELPEDYPFNYGLLLKRMGEYEKAKRYFMLYRSVDSEKAEHFVKSCDFAMASLAGGDEFEVNLYAPSSKSTDFGPTVFRDNLVFCSFRKDFKRDLGVHSTSLIQNEKCQLFKSGMGFTGELNNTDYLLPDGEETYDLGPVHYASEAPVCAVTKNNFRDGEKQIFSDDLELSLYIAKVREDGSFDAMYPFPHNEVGYATGFGTLNPTGKILYFSSNRPGGYGGFDIYVSFYKNGQWTYPDNLGPTINTEGNEITPFFDGTTLYFSSDYHIGLGGYDVFSSQVDYGKWTLPENMENGINSPEDDFYFIKHPFMDSYYLTSNRLGGRGYHDIYLVNKAPSEELVAAAGATTPRAVDLENDVSEDGWEGQTDFVSYKEIETSPNIVNDTEADIPEAVEIARSGEFRETTAATEDDNIVPAAEPVDFDNMFMVSEENINKYTVADVSLVGARRFALGEVITREHENVYFIQLAALFKSKADMSVFETLTRYGSLYKVQQTNATKIKLGYFMNETAAKDILTKVKSLGYRDAFVTYEAMDPARLELVSLSEDINIENSNKGYVTDYTTGLSYKIRLASYVDPIWFEVEKVDDLGIIEQWSKGDWTIFVLGGYRNQNEAEAAMAIARKRGFKDAEIVLDRNGILEKLQ